MAENSSEEMEFDKLFEDILSENPKSVDEKMDAGDFNKVKKQNNKQKRLKPAKLKKKTALKTNQNEKNNKNKSKFDVGSIFKTALMTVFCMVVCAGFLVVSLSSVAPDLMIKTFEYVGAKDAVYTIYKRKYNRDHSNENLYNVIQISINRLEYEDMANYIELMMNGDKFNKFAKKIDEETKKALGEVYSVYANSYETYLKGYWVLGLYKSGNTLSAKALALDSIEGSVRELYVYVGCIQDDESLSENQKKTELLTLQSRFKLVDMLNGRLSSLDDEYSMATTEGGKLVAINQKILILDVILAIGQYSLNDEEYEVYDLMREELKLEAGSVLDRLKTKN